MLLLKSSDKTMDGKESCKLKSVVYVRVYQPALGTSFLPIVYQIKFALLALVFRVFPISSVPDCPSTCQPAILFLSSFSTYPVLRSLSNHSYPKEASSHVSSFRLCSQNKGVSAMASH